MSELNKIIGNVNSVNPEGSIATNTNSKVAITTIDNPYDPFTDFSNWLMYDEVIKGYNTCAYLGRVCNTAESLSDDENDEEVERAIDEIIKNDPFNIYIKVFNPEYS